MSTATATETAPEADTVAEEPTPAAPIDPLTVPEPTARTIAWYEWKLARVKALTRIEANTAVENGNITRATSNAMLTVLGIDPHPGRKLYRLELGLEYMVRYELWVDDGQDPAELVRPNVEVDQERTRNGHNSIRNGTTFYRLPTDVDYTQMVVAQDETTGSGTDTPPMVVFEPTGPRLADATRELEVLFQNVTRVLQYLRRHHDLCEGGTNDAARRIGIPNFSTRSLVYNVDLPMGTAGWVRHAVRAWDESDALVEATRLHTSNAAGRTLNYGRFIIAGPNNPVLGDQPVVRIA